MKIMLIIITALFVSGCGSSEEITTEEAVLERPIGSMKILAFGQSNMANMGIGLTYTSAYDVLRLDNTYDFVLASSPVGATALASGTGANILPYLGDLLIQDGKYSDITYANVAVNGSCIVQWIPSSPNFQRIVSLVNQGFEFTHVLFHQGSCDTRSILKEDYKKYFLEMKNGLRNLGIIAPIYLGRASYIYGVVDSQVTDAQNELINENDDILMGANTDVLGAEYRYDDSHFNEQGLIKHAQLWNDLIK